jgi:hypothetical protein
MHFVGFAFSAKKPHKLTKNVILLKKLHFSTVFAYANAVLKCNLLFKKSQIAFLAKA